MANAGGDRVRFGWPILIEIELSGDFQRASFIPTKARFANHSCRFLGKMTTTGRATVRTSCVVIGGIHFQSAITHRTIVPEERRPIVLIGSAASHRARDRSSIADPPQLSSVTGNKLVLARSRHSSGNVLVPITSTTLQIRSPGRLFQQIFSEETSRRASGVCPRRDTSSPIGKKRQLCETWRHGGPSAAETCNQLIGVSRGVNLTLSVFCSRFSVAKEKEATEKHGQNTDETNRRAAGERCR